MDNEKSFEARINSEFTELEAVAERVCPGISELLQAYGQHEAAVVQANAYLSVVAPPVNFTTTDTSV